MTQEGGEEIKLEKEWVFEVAVEVAVVVAVWRRTVIGFFTARGEGIRRYSFRRKGAHSIYNRSHGT